MNEPSTTVADGATDADTPRCPFCPATTVRRAGTLTCPDCDWHERRGAD